MKLETYRQVVEIIEQSTVGLDQDAFFSVMQEVTHRWSEEYGFTVVLMLAKAWTEVLYRRFPHLREQDRALGADVEEPAPRRLH